MILPLCFRCASKRAPPAPCCVGEMKQHKEQVQSRNRLATETTSWAKVQNDCANVL